MSGVKQEQPWPSLMSTVPLSDNSDLDQFEFLEPIRADLCVEQLPDRVEQELESQKRKRRIKNEPIDPSLPKSKRQKLNRMRKNRESAQKSREKKARHRAMLNEQVRMLKTQNGQLERAVGVLSDKATEARELQAANEALQKEIREQQQVQKRLLALTQGGGRATTLSLGSSTDGSTKVEPQAVPAANAFPGSNGTIQILDSAAFPFHPTSACKAPAATSGQLDVDRAPQQLPPASDPFPGLPPAAGLFSELLLQNQPKLMPNMFWMNSALPTVAPPQQLGAALSPRIPIV